jgi:photosystem II stability/assembly factor-like uncharacterized protein
MRPRLTLAGPALPIAAVLVLTGCGSPAGGPAAVQAPSASAASGSAGPTVASASPGVRNGAPCRPSAGLSASDFFTYDGRDALSGVQFVSHSQGWVVGRHVILATSDGGATWTAQDRGELNLVSVDFISAEAGWAVGLNSVLTTSDGGRHWTALPEPCAIIRSVHFLSPRVGFAIAGGVNPVSGLGLAPSSGGAVVYTSNGGRSWRPVAAPADPQTVCFSDSESGWLGAHGKLYFSKDAGRSWRLQARGPHGNGAPTAPGVMFVQCASGSAWALDVGPGAGMSQEPHIGYHATPAGAVPFFAENYFPHPGVRVPFEAPGSYAGPMSAISSSEAVFVDSCPACGYGSAPWGLALGGGAKLIRAAAAVGGINYAFGASFITASEGWVVGTIRSGRTIISRIVHTADGGGSWQVQYVAR